MKKNNDIVLALKTSGTNCIPMYKSDKTSTFRPIAEWNKYVKVHYSITQDALWWWKLYNKPKTGAIYQRMRSTKAQFKYALRSVRKSEEMFKAYALASDVLNNDYDSL